MRQKEKQITIGRIQAQITSDNHVHNEQGIKNQMKTQRFLQQNAGVI